MNSLKKADSRPRTSSRLLARNAVLNLLAEGWVFFALIVTMPKLVTYLGQTRFGLFSLAWVVIGYMSLLDVGVSRAATKYISEHLAQGDTAAVQNVAKTSLAANLLLGLLGGLAIAVFTPFLVHSVFRVSPILDNQARLVLYVVALSVPTLLVNSVLRAILASYQRFGWINVINGLATTIQWVLACSFAWRGYGVAVVVLATVVVRIVATAAYGVLLTRLVPHSTWLDLRTLTGLSKLLRFGSWVTLSQLVGPILIYVDRIFLASFVSLSAVTLYTVPYEITTRLRIIPSSLVATTFPALSESGAGGDKIHLNRLYGTSLRYLLLLLIPLLVFFCVLGPDVLSVWMGSQFAQETSPTFQMLACGALINALAYVPYSALQALGRPDFVGKLHACELPVHLGLCMLLVPKWGIAGAALASAFRFTLDAGLLFWAAQRFCSCSLKSFWKQGFGSISIITVLLSITMLGVRMVLSTNWLRLSVGIALVGLYCLVSWRFALSAREKPVVARALMIFRDEAAS